MKSCKKPVPESVGSASPARQTGLERVPANRLRPECTGRPCAHACSRCAANHPAQCDVAQCCEVQAAHSSIRAKRDLRHDGSLPLSVLKHEAVGCDTA